MLAQGPFSANKNTFRTTRLKKRFRVIRKRLSELGLSLPAVNPPIASYVPSVRENGIVYVSGQLPLKEGQLLLTGQMIPGRSVEEAQAAMRQCFLNAVAAALLVCNENELKRVLRLGAFVASSAEFTEQHKVANGASDLAREVFGDAGIHARAAVGVSSLPLNATVELEVSFSVS
ncbi:MAG: RidA family protein [Leptospirales bacterium]|nr:RidA family protein [Leptospirales bacterium]